MVADELDGRGFPSGQINDRAMSFWKKDAVQDLTNLIPYAFELRGKNENTLRSESHFGMIWLEIGRKFDGTRFC